MQRYTLYAAAIAGLILGALVAAPYVGAQAPPLLFGSGTCAASVTVVTSTETALATTAGITTKGAQTVRLHGFAQVTAGAGTTAYTFNWRRGSGTSGTQVTTPTAVSATAGANAVYAYDLEDKPGEVAGQQYTLTVKDTGATANGTVQNCEGWALTY